MSQREVDYGVNVRLTMGRLTICIVNVRLTMGFCWNERGYFLSIFAIFR